MNKNNVILPIVLVLAAILLVGGFVALKKHKDRVAPTPAPVAQTVEEPEEEQLYNDEVLDIEINEPLDEFTVSLSPLYG